MGGRKHKPRNRNEVKSPVLPERSVHQIRASKDDPIVSKQRRQNYRKAKAQQDKRVNWTLMIAVIGTVAAIVAAVIAYQSYKLTNEQPDLSLQVYKTENDKELYYANLSIGADSIREENDFIEFEVPLKIINDSDKDAESITIWLRPQTSDVQLLYPPTSWIAEKHAGQDWNVINATPLSPQTGAKFHGVTLRAKKGVHEAKLLWKIYAARMLPRKGDIVLYF